MADKDKKNLHTTGPEKGNPITEAAKAAVEYGKKKHSDYARKQSEQKAATKSRKSKAASEARKSKSGAEDAATETRAGREAVGDKELSPQDVSNILEVPLRREGSPMLSTQQREMLNKELRRRNVEKIRGPKKEE